MRIEFDAAKEATNIKKHGLSFIDIPFLDWANAIIIEDSRKDYGEKRMAAFLYGNGIPYNVIYTERGSVRRIISFRRAHEKERKRYGQEN
jgi:uncharacterized DUF497 family protein